MKLASGAVLGPLRQVFGGESVSGLSEGELLDRFLAGRDEPSFSALVARLGPMVLGVCRRTLTDPRDVEDAFQATFLVLVRRGGTLRDRDRLAPWLFGVARRVAARARSESARRRARERPWAGEPAEDPGLDDHRAELARALVEEIDRLPDPLRSVVVLCCGEGLSYEEAAARLRCTVPAIRGRLARARERLRTRLVRRGFAPTAGLLAAWTAAEGTAATVPIHLIEMTTRSALACAAGTMAAPGTIPAVVATLAEGATRTMILTKWKFLAAGLTTLGVASGVGVLAQQPTPSAPGGATTATVEERTVPIPPPGQAQFQAEAPSLNPTPSSAGRSPFDQDSPSSSTPASAPMPTPAIPPPVEDRRLDSLENKLDRVLRALDPAESPRTSRRTEPVAPPSRSRASVTVGADEQDLPPAPMPPPPARRSATRPSRAVGSSPRPEEPSILPDPGIDRTKARANPGTISSRLDAVEQKLGRLEARFAEMERKLGIQTGEATTSQVRSPFELPAPTVEPGLEAIPQTTYQSAPPDPGNVLIPAPSAEPSDVRPLENYPPRPR